MNGPKITIISNADLIFEYVPLAHAKNYHWNIAGATFNRLYKFTEGQYELFNINVNEVAERISFVGVK